MPHQCVRCGSIYEDNASEIMSGCSCGSKLFYYLPKDKIESLKSRWHKSKEAGSGAETEVLEIIDESSEIHPALLETGSIRVEAPGKYELDLVRLFNDKVPIFEISEGKFILDLKSALNTEKSGRSRR